MGIFLDTYAIVAIDTDSHGYKKYNLTSIGAITTLFNLTEVYFVYIKKFGEKEADEIYNIVKNLVVPVDEFIIKEAMKFKFANQKKRYSMADCIGYITALKLNIKFVTGDYAFKEMENVEFIK